MTGHGGTRKCDHVGAAVYRSLDGSEQICYRCGRPVEQPPEPEVVRDTETDLTSGGDYPELREVPRPEPSTNIAGKVGREHPETSKVAAARIRPASGTQRAKVLAKLTAAFPNGMTDEELQDSLAMNPSSQRPRRVELVEQSWIEDSGDRRKTRSGTDAIVWRYNKVSWDQP